MQFFSNLKLKIAQTLKSIRFMRCKSGEDNISAKISNQKGIEIYEKAIAENADIAQIAKEANLSEVHVRKIKNLEARRSITLKYLTTGEIPSKPKFLSAKRNKGRKLSQNLAEFIRKDSAIMHLEPKILAEKCCVTTSTIRKILKNKMYKRIENNSL